MKKQYRLTEEGLSEIQAELEDLISQRRTIAEAIKTAREFGDLAENAEYQVARQEQEKNENRISEIEHIVANVEIISAPKSGSKVVLGSTVTLMAADGKTTKQFQVVGTVEADPLNGKISDESPIGQALIGKKAGDTVEIKTPADITAYNISAIN